jgi:hypothetical protein
MFEEFYDLLADPYELGRARPETLCQTDFCSLIIFFFMILLYLAYLPVENQALQKVDGLDQVTNFIVTFLSI